MVGIVCDTSEAVKDVKNLFDKHGCSKASTVSALYGTPRLSAHT